MTTTTQQKLETLEDVIQFCKNNDLPGDIVGEWVWIEFESKPDKDVRDNLKAAGFHWIPKRGKWAHNCGVHARRGIGNPYHKYPVARIEELA